MQTDGHVPIDLSRSGLKDIRAQLRSDLRKQSRGFQTGRAKQYRTVTIARNIESQPCLTFPECKMHLPLHSSGFELLDCRYGWRNTLHYSPHASATSVFFTLTATGYGGKPFGKIPKLWTTYPYRGQKHAGSLAPRSLRAALHHCQTCD